MLTRDEKELLEALKEHMDDEQKEALSEASEEEIKGFLKEAKKEMEKEMRRQGVSSEPEGCMETIRDLRDCPWREVWHDDGRWNKGNPVYTLLIKLLLKIGSTKVGCGFLIVVAIVIVIAGIIAGNT
jgi:hypothetical protein